MDNLLTVLIPTRNRGEDLLQAFSNAKKCNMHKLQYILYDDASDCPSDTVAASRQLASARVVLGKERLGQAAGRNILLRECETPYAVFMDDDTWFTCADSLSNILAQNLTYDGIGRASAVCSQVFRTYDGAKIFPEKMDTRRIINPLGGGCIVRVDDILGIGGFRPYWRYRHEETELGMRMWKHGLPVVYDPSLVVEHCHTSAARSSTEYDQNSARNVILMHALNLPGFAGLPKGLLRSLRLLLVKDCSKRSISQGIVEGLVDFIRYREDCDPMSRQCYREFVKFQRELMHFMNQEDDAHA